MFATIHAWWTVLMLVIFIGIVVWAYSGRRKKDFEEAARLALDEDDETRPRREDGDANG